VLIAMRRKLVLDSILVRVQGGHTETQRNDFLTATSAR
jgi:hypothetical protein